MSHVFAYPTDTWNFMIIKRRPFNYHITKMDVKTGADYDEIFSGTAMELPIWDWVKTENGIMYAGLGTMTYDITDLVS